jgi:NUMOD4 motif/HNH endonuclease
MKERWLPIPGYDGYEVSDHGRVRSLDRVVKSRWGTPKPIKGRDLVQSSQGRYKVVSLHKEGRMKTVRVHQMVLLTFVGPRPEGMHGCHRDDDPDNNRPENLYWGTPAQNSRDMVNNGSCWKSNITHCPQGHEYTAENTYVVAKTGHRQCRACIKARSEAHSKAHTTMPYSADRTHCPQGHLYAGDNLVINSQGRRTCRECVRKSAREYQWRKRNFIRSEAPT